MSSLLQKTKELIGLKPKQTMLKMVIIGSPIQKDKILSKIYKNNGFDELTVGQDFTVCCVKQNGTEYKFQIWDTCTDKLKCQKTDCVMLLFNVNRRTDFDEINECHQNLDKYFGTQKPILILAGYQPDNTTGRVVSVEEGGQKAIEFGCNYIELKGDTIDNLDDALKLIALYWRKQVD